MRASPASITESGTTAAQLIFSLEAPVGNTTRLTFQLSGTASNGVDFQNVPSQMTIPAGQIRGSLALVPIADTLVEGTETVTVTITASDNVCVVIGTPNMATVSITEGPELLLSTALDETNLVWTSGGDTSWAPQTAVTHDGIDAAQSGFVSHEQESWLQTTVSGPGTITFWWRVSSELDYDWLRFHIDGVFQQQISGEVNWQQRSFSVPDGPHALRWRYIKDLWDTAGQDSSWVDEVKFTQSSGAPTIVLHPRSQTVWPGANVTLSAVALGGPPLSHQWYFNETHAIVGATQPTLTLSNVRAAEAGRYHVVVSNAFDSISSSIALLTITNNGPATSVLLFVDGPVASPYQAALEQLSYSYQRFTDEPQFNQAVATANRNNTLVVIDATDQAHDFRNVQTFIGGAGRALVQAYTLNGDVSLAATLQVVVERRFTTPPPLRDWGGSPFFEGLTSPFSLTDLGFPENGQQYHVLAGGYGVAGFAANPQPGVASVVIGNSGRTIVNGFFVEDATSPADAVRFAHNQIEFLINPPVPMQLVAPAWIGGVFQVQLSGRAGLACSVQASGDLKLWNSVTNLTLSATPMVVSIPTPPDRNFYRIIAPPVP